MWPVFWAFLGLVTLSSAATAGFRHPSHLLPPQFKAKARIWWTGNDQPSLLFFHYADHGQRTREDYYALVGTNHTRVYTSINLAGDSNRAFRIFHRQAKSPHACILLPSAGPLFDPSTLRTARYVGRAEMVQQRPAPREREGGGGEGEEEGGEEDDSAPLVDVAVPCAHWRLPYHKATVDLCLDIESGAPLLLQHPVVRVEVTRFEATSFTPSQLDALFDPARVASVPCGPLGG